MIPADRAERVSDVIAVETIAPGMIRVVTWSDAYPVDARDAGCNCPDKQYREVSMCKHEHAALLADTELPTPFIVSDNLDERVATDNSRCEDCADLPDDFPCASCYIGGDADFPEGKA